MSFLAQTGNYSKFHYFSDFKTFYFEKIDLNITKLCVDF